MKTIEVEGLTYEVVDVVPKGYSVWNIGHHMVDGYVPLCEVYEGTYNIIPTTLKTIKLNEARKLLEYASYSGCTTLKECERYLKRKHKDAYRERYATLLLPLLKKLKWEDQ